MSDRPRILVDAIAYSPHDGGFTTALHDLLDTCRRLQEFEFVIVHDRKYSSVFRAFGLATYSVVIPKSLRFFASLALLPFIARRIGATAVHCEVSALPWFLGVPGSVTVHDLYFLIDPRAGGRTLRQRVMRRYWEGVFLASSESLINAQPSIATFEPFIFFPSLSRAATVRLYMCSGMKSLTFLAST